MKGDGGGLAVDSHATRTGTACRAPTTNNGQRTTDMIKNYLKIALRNLRMQKGYSFINIAGLEVGMACCLLIALFVRDELSYDRQQGDGERQHAGQQEDLSADVDVVGSKTSPTV